MHALHSAIAALRPGGKTVETVTRQAEPSGGEIGQQLEEVLPETGNESIDSAVDTLASAVGNLAEAFIRHVPQLVIALVVLVVTGFTASLLRRLVVRLVRRLNLRQSLRDLCGQLTLIAVWFLGLAVAAGIVFPGFGVGELVASAGLLSIALGFAFQDIFENFFAGVLILWRFPFEPGDFIEIESEGIVGEVEEIWIRMTLIRLTTGELVTVPNATVYKSPIRILTNRDQRRLTVACGVAYGEDVAEARRVIQSAVEACESVHRDAPIQIFLTGFGDSSMDFEVTWWTGPKPLDQRESRDEVIEAVKAALDEAGIEIPYPYRVLTFSDNEPLIHEKLVEAGRGAVTADE